MLILSTSISKLTIYLFYSLTLSTVTSKLSEIIVDILFTLKFYPHPLSTSFSQTHSLWIISKSINKNNVDKLVRVLKSHIFFDTIRMFSSVEYFSWEIYYPQLLIICGQVSTQLLDKCYPQHVSM